MSVVSSAVDVIRVGAAKFNGSAPNGSQSVLAKLKPTFLMFVDVRCITRLPDLGDCEKIYVIDMLYH